MWSVNIGNWPEFGKALFVHSIRAHIAIIEYIYGSNLDGEVVKC